MKCFPEILKSNCLRVLSLSSILKGPRRKTTFFLNDDFVCFCLEVFCLVLLVRIGVHNRISVDFPLFHCYFFVQSSRECLCLCLIQRPKKSLKTKILSQIQQVDFLGTFILPQSKHRSLGGHVRHPRDTR